MRSRARSPNQFDAWSHFHLGLTHAFRFSPKENQIAARHFENALALDPHFGRAHAGISFVHWQTAFMRMEDKAQDYFAAAVSEAKLALGIDANDPFAKFCMGRAVWLLGDMEASLYWLDRGLTTNPNYAHGHYTKGVIHNMRGDYNIAHGMTGRAISLSPLDPLYYGTLANQTLTEVALGNLPAAMELAEKSVHSPGTYYYPVLWAAIAADLNGNQTLMRRWRDRALAEWPDASADVLLQPFPLQDPELKKTIRDALMRMEVQ